jgi:hypothetical protein
MTEISLEDSGIDAFVGQRVAAGMPELILDCQRISAAHTFVCQLLPNLPSRKA